MDSSYADGAEPAHQAVGRGLVRADVVVIQRLGQRDSRRPTGSISRASR